MKNYQIPYSRQSISREDVDAVKKVLKSSLITTGPAVPRFEKQISKYCKVRHTVAVNSASSALYIACIAINIKKNDLVWTTPITFASTASCALSLGAKVDFVDIDEVNFNMCAVKLEDKLKKAKKQNKLPKLVIPVHFAGLSCDMKRIKELSKKYGFFIIEDASHALGGRYKNSKVGSCQYSDFTVFSFHPVKTITTGEGGAVTTNSTQLYEKLKILRENGISKNNKYFKNKSHGPWYYEQQYVSNNFKMSDINASLGISQLKKIQKFVKKRNNIAEIYKKKFDLDQIKIQSFDKSFYSSYHLFIILVPRKLRNALFDYLRKFFFVNVHYIPLFYHPVYNFKSKLKFSNAIDYYQKTISIPIYYDLKIKDQLNVIKKINSFLKKNIIN